MDFTLFSAKKHLVCSIWFCLFYLIEEITQHLLDVNHYTELRLDIPR